MDYEEKLLVGHRWYERKNIKSLFPFGHGLSYTDFSYGDLEISVGDNADVVCRFNIENIGYMDGQEVAQCYVSYESSPSDEPIKSLQSFKKVLIEKQKKQEIEIHLNARNFSYWDVKDKDWKIRPGSYSIEIGSSSEKIELSETITLGN